MRRLLVAAAFLLFALQSRAGAESVMADLAVTGPDGTPVPSGDILLFRPMEREAYYAANRGEPPADAPSQPAARAKIRNGRAGLTLPGPGDWRILAMAPGLAVAESHLAWFPGFPAPRVTLCLGPGGAIEGRVLRKDGRPLTGAVVLARSRILDFEVRTRTDAEGRYRLSGLAPGSHGLWVRRPDGRWVADVIFLSPSLAHRDIRGADEPEGQRGGGRPASVWEKRSFTKGNVTVTGVVRDRDGAPIPLARVEAMDGLPVLTDAEGRFAASGRSRAGWAFGVDVSRVGYSPDTVYVNPDDPEAWSGVEVVLEKRPVLMGRVASSAGLPVGGGLVWVASLHFGKFGRTSGAWSRGPVAAIEPDGSFEVPVASREEIDRMPSSSWSGIHKSVYVLGVTVTGHGPAVSEPVELVSGRTEYPVRLPLFAGLRLSGVVRDAVTGKPLVGVELSANGKGMSAWPPGCPPISGYAVRSLTDQAGCFEFGDLAAGGLSLSVKAPLYKDAWVDVVLPAKGPVEVELMPFREIAGVVVDVAGEPVAAATVFRLADDGSGREREVRTDSRGRFLFEKVPAGKYTVIAHRSFHDDPCAPSSFGPIAAGRKDLRLVLRPGEVLAGRVFDADGAPLSGVVVSAGTTTDRPARRYERTDEDGNYRLQGLPSGPLIVQILREGVTIRGVRPGPKVNWVVDGRGEISGGIRRQEYEVLHRPRGELRAVPLEDRTLVNITRRYDARLDWDDGTFTFRRLLPGTYRIEGTVTAGFRLQRRTFRVRGEVVAKVGDEDVEIRLVFAED